MKKTASRFVITSLCLCMILSMALPAGAATVVNSYGGGKMQLLRGSNMGADITNNSVYYVGDIIYPVFRINNTVWRSGAGKMSDESTIKNGAYINNEPYGGAFVLTKAGTYTIKGSYYGAGGAINGYCTVQITVLPKT